MPDLHENWLQHWSLDVQGVPTPPQHVLVALVAVLDTAQR
jgi:hypothetical protein